MPINLEFAECPKCGEPIDDDKEAGDTCDDCGYVFPATHEEAEAENADEPQEGDYTTPDHRKFYQYGKLVLNLDEDADHVAEVKKHMERNKFWPDVWFISDHGNAHRIVMT